MKRLVLILLLIAACKRQEVAVPKVAPAGDPGRGKLLIEQYGCNACHQVPGVEGPAGILGPPLEHMAARSLIAGHVPNTVENMNRYLQNPQAVFPEGTMPNLNVTPQDAKDLTAFLGTLQ